MILKSIILFVFLISSSYAALLGSFSNDIKDFQNEINPNSKIWVVLAATSKTYSNYRHQANVLHAYQLVQKIHKIPKEQIVLMMYDDIAYNRRNPYQGNVINYPNGENLYSSKYLISITIIDQFFF